MTQNVSVADFGFFSFHMLFEHFLNVVDKFANKVIKLNLTKSSRHGGLFGTACFCVNAPRIPRWDTAYCAAATSDAEIHIACILEHGEFAF